MLSQTYYDRITAILRQINETQSQNIQAAAQLIADALIKGNILHLFGCGHSHMLVEEGFWRAGGLVPINPLFDTAVMLHEGATKSSAVERLEGYAALILDNHIIERGDVIIIFSTSGRNGLVVDMAKCAKEKGMSVIVVTSLAYKNIPSRHSSGKRLEAMADLVIDNCCPYGDALVELPGQNTSISPGSTVAGATILNMIYAELAEAWTAKGGTPEYFISGNIDVEYDPTEDLVKKYRSRIKSL